MSQTTRLIECVPNFSEGRNQDIIQHLIASIRAVEGVRLLHSDSGKATNRTVITFVGQPEVVIEAAFQAILTAGKLIDMQTHSGAHPRLGATDVCPLIPLAGVTMAETVTFAHMLAERVGRELNLPVYLYEEAQPDKTRSDLATIRSGEYEGLPVKLRQPGWHPDYGPAAFDAKRGATVIGARELMIAYNINLNTTSTRRANAIAFDVREAGRTFRAATGNETIRPGTLKAVKALGWYIEEYGIAQVSMNLVNLTVTPLHVAFDEACHAAQARGIRVTGSELIGLVPVQCLIDAGRYYLEKQRRSIGVPEHELVRIAIRTLGLEELGPFNPEERVIEYLLRDKDDSRLIEQSLLDFAHETASERPLPGGGSVAAYVGALGTALATMVANLSSHKRGWDARWQEFSDQASVGQQYLRELLMLVDEDSNAYSRVIAAFALPARTSVESAERHAEIQNATKLAVLTPLRVMTTALAVMTLIKSMVETGVESAVSDAAVGALCIRTAVIGANLNIRINASALTDQVFVANVLQQGAAMELKAQQLESHILTLVDQKIKN